MRQALHFLIRPLGMTLVLVMLLVQAYLLFHETSHAVSGEDESCLVCQLAQHQDHALISQVSLAMSADFLPPQYLGTQVFIRTSARYFASRAPPVSILL